MLAVWARLPVARLTVLSAILVPGAIGTTLARAEECVISLRPESPHALWLVNEGQRRSATLAELAARVPETDIIVIVRAEPLRGMAGSTVFTADGGSHRYVTVTISTRESAAVQIATLAHELVHVLEIADALEVRSQAGMQALYERIGHRGLRHGCFETRTALEAGARARADLASWTGGAEPVMTAP